MRAGIPSLFAVLDGVDEASCRFVRTLHEFLLQEHDLLDRGDVEVVSLRPHSLI